MAKGSSGGFIRLPGGLMVPANAAFVEKQTFANPKLHKLGKKPPQGKIGFRTRRVLKVGEKEFEISGSTIEARDIHKLEPDERKERRADNKTMARSRKLHRRRKGHGRP